MIRRPPISTLFPYTPLSRFVMDKPMAPSLTEAERLVEAGGALTVFQNRRLDGDFLTLQGILERGELGTVTDRKSTRLNSSHSQISYAVFCLKKKKKQESTIV